MWVRRIVNHSSRCALGSPASSPFHNPLPRSPIGFGSMKVKFGCNLAGLFFGLAKVAEGINCVGVEESSMETVPATPMRPEEFVVVQALQIHISKYGGSVGRVVATRGPFLNNHRSKMVVVLHLVMDEGFPPIFYQPCNFSNHPYGLWGVSGQVGGLQVLPIWPAAVSVVHHGMGCVEIRLWSRHYICLRGQLSGDDQKQIGPKKHTERWQCITCFSLNAGDDLMLAA
eukprot:486788-Pelagomonas_calceolata.AAC.1